MFDWDSYTSGRFDRSHTKSNRGRGGIGRRVRLRTVWATVGVQLPPPAPPNHSQKFFKFLFRFGAQHLNYCDTVGEWCCAKHQAIMASGVLKIIFTRLTKLSIIISLITTPAKRAKKDFKEKTIVFSLSAHENIFAEGKGTARPLGRALGKNHQGFSLRSNII